MENWAAREKKFILIVFVPLLHFVHDKFTYHLNVTVEAKPLSSMLNSLLRDSP